MNEISHIVRPGFEPGASLPNPHILMVEEIAPGVTRTNPCNALLSALVRVQAVLENPTEDKTADVYSKRTNQRYSFGYAKLASVLSLVRKPLAEQGVLLSSWPASGDKMLFELLHAETGQFTRTLVDLRPDEAGTQARASAQTYWRRQTLLMALGLHNAGPDDDDGVAAAGDTGTFSDGRGRRRPETDWRAEVATNSPPQTEQETLEELATHAANVEDGHRLLALWLAQALRMDRLRVDNNPTWRETIKLVATALERCFSRYVGVAWLAFARVETRADEQAAQRLLDTAWARDIAELRQYCPHAYADFMRHRNRCMPKPAPTVAAQPSVKEPPVTEAMFAHNVIDAAGDMATDTLGTPVAWAQAFAAVWDKTPADERNALCEFNADVLTLVERDPMAAMVLRGLPKVSETPPEAGQPDPSQPEDTAPVAIREVPVPLTRQGLPDFASYVKVVETDLAKVRTPADLAAWLAVNEPVFASERIKPGTQARLLQIVVARKDALGLGRAA